MRKTRLQTLLLTNEYTSIPSLYPRLAAWLFIILLAAALIPEIAEAQASGATTHESTPPGQRFVRWAWHDAYALIRSVDGPGLLWGAGGLAAIAGLTPLDRPVRNRAERGAGRFVRSFTDGANFIAGPYVAIPATLGVFGASLISRDLKFQDAAFTSFQSLAYASGVTLFVKLVVGRHRPRDTRSPYRFDPFSAHRAFPSGHTTAMFAMLVPWAMYYPHPITWGVAVVGGSGAALARILKNKHWLTDVLGGATVGIVTGVLLARRHQNLPSAGTPPKQSFHLYPQVAPDRTGLALSIHL